MKCELFYDPRCRTKWWFNSVVLHLSDTNVELVTMHLSFVSRLPTIQDLQGLLTI